MSNYTDAVTKQDRYDKLYLNIAKEVSNIPKHIRGERMSTYASVHQQQWYWPTFSPCARALLIQTLCLALLCLCLSLCLFHFLCVWLSQTLCLAKLRLSGSCVQNSAQPGCSHGKIWEI